jgi:hypothetical protein
LKGDVFNRDQIEAFMELKWEEVYAFEHAVGVTFDQSDQLECSEPVVARSTSQSLGEAGAPPPIGTPLKPPLPEMAGPRSR